MSIGLQVFLVPGYEVQGLTARNEARLRKSLEAAGPRLAEFDAMAAPDPDLSHEQAVRELYAGLLSRPDLESTYRMAFLALCEIWAGSEGRLPNDRFLPIGASLIADLDAEAEAAGVSLSFLDLVRTPPIPLPPWGGGFPSAGHWDMTVVERASVPLATAVAGIADPEIRAAFEQVRGWFERATRVDELWRATRRPRPLIVGFLG